jgi:superfamily II DNA or RNA helicase
MQLNLLQAPMPQSIELRPYQKQMVGGVYGAIKSGKRRILMIALMGLGKTILASWIMRDAVKRGKRCLFLVPLTVLIDQTIETLELLGVHCSALQGDRNYDKDASVTVASLQTISSRLRQGHSLDAVLGAQHLLFADEAHVTAFDKAYSEIEDYVLGHHGYCIGMTATPWRLSKKQWLGQKFDIAVEGPQPPDAIKLGAVVPCRGFRFGGVFDYSTLKVNKGDYTLSSVAAQATTPEALSLIVAEWQRLALSRPSMMVGATVEQAKLTAQAFESVGIKTAVIIGETPLEERLAIFEQVKRGEVQIICSVGCLTAGFNLPMISCILYVRATKSQSLFFQTAGRGSRPAQGKSDFLLLDFGDNLKRFGNPMGYQCYDIDGEMPEPGEALYKTCPDCHAEVINFAQVCPHCGFEFGMDDEIAIELPTGQLSEYVDQLTRKKISALRKWKKESWKTKASPDAPIEKFVSEYHHIPPAEWMLNACLTRRSSVKTRKRFLAYLEGCYRGKKEWRQPWLDYHLRLEFGDADLSKLLECDWQSVLGVPYSASWDEVKAAYMNALKEVTEADIERGHELSIAFEDAKDSFTAQSEATA